MLMNWLLRREATREMSHDAPDASSHSYCRSEREFKFRRYRNPARGDIDDEADVGASVC
jgi:hypothetical protein